VISILQVDGSNPTVFGFRFRCGGLLAFFVFAFASPAICAFIFAPFKRRDVRSRLGDYRNEKRFRRDVTVPLRNQPPAIKTSQFVVLGRCSMKEILVKLLPALRPPRNKP
jgi:hypothetical protein